MAFKAILHCHNSTGRVLAKSTRNLSWSIMDGLQSQFIPTEARCRANTIASTHHITAKANLFLINSGKIMLCLVPSMSATTKRDLKALSCSIKELVEVCWPLLKHQEARRLIGTSPAPDVHVSSLQLSICHIQDMFTVSTPANIVQNILGLIF